jgi:hypothetical protein
MHHPLAASVPLLLCAALTLVSTVRAQEKPAAKDTAYVLPGISVTTARHAASPLALPFAITRVDAREWKGHPGVRARGCDLEGAGGPGPVAVRHQ